MRVTNFYGCKEIENNRAKPCPFCGGEPMLLKQDRYPNNGQAVDGFTVICVDSKCVIYGADNLYYRTPKRAINRWNDRAAGGKENDKG